MEAQTFDYYPLKIMIPQLVINKQFLKQWLLVFLYLLGELNNTCHQTIATGLQQMDEKDQDAAENLHEISFNIALQDLPFTALRSQVKIEKLHGVNFMGSYEN